MQSLKSPYILYNQQSVGSTLHNNLLFIIHPFILIVCTEGVADKLPSLNIWITLEMMPFHRIIRINHRCG